MCGERLHAIMISTKIISLYLVVILTMSSAQKLDYSLMQDNEGNQPSHLCVFIDLEKSHGMYNR